MAHAWAALLLAACASARMRGAPRDPARERAAALARAEVQTIDERLAYWTAPTGGQRPNSSTYLTFELDSGGWNNVRMGVETMLAIAHVTRRTLVLPPRESARLPPSFAALHVRRGDFTHAANATAEDFYKSAAPLLAPGEAVYAATDADPSFLDAFRARGHAVATRADFRDVFDAAGLSEDMHGPAEQLVATLGRAFVGSEGPSGRADGDAPGPAPRPLANCTPPSRVRSFPTPPPFVGYDYSGDECSCAYARGLSLCPAKKTGRSQDRARHAAAPCAR
ncbi:hypothetical protein JL722_7675 [Aureococcus anophagefferens]|nr:hypothetical protein JL722_7675 [Aureococcus anophagefferens]